MKETEIWRSFPLDRRYQLSTLGRLRRKSNKKIRKANVKQNGYRGVTLTKPNSPLRSYDLHTMVALTWLGPRPLGMDVSHLDGDRLNNRVTNLAYESRKQNAGKRFNNFNRFGGKRKLTPKLVREIRRDTLLTNGEWSIKLNVSRKTIWKVRKLITWKNLLATPQTK